MTDNVSISVDVVAVLVATIALLFSWRAIKISEKTVAIGLFNEMQKAYQAEMNFQANRLAWDLYKQFPAYKNSKPISVEEAMIFVKTTDHSSPEWKSIHDLTLFWRHLSFMLRKDYLQQDIVFETFTSPAILGLLYPIENAFMQFHGLKVDYDRSLEKLYTMWTQYDNLS